MKAIAIVELPDGVDPKHFVIDYTVWFHGATWKENPIESKVNQELKAVPQRKETDGTEPCDVYMFREGWNLCLDAITGEKRGFGWDDVRQEERKGTD